MIRALLPSGRASLPASLAVALLLAGCSNSGPSVSGSASESAGSGSSLSNLWERVRSLGFESGKTHEMPALGLMADAFMADMRARELNDYEITGAVFGRDADGSIASLPDQLAASVAPTRASLAALDADELRARTPLDAAHMVYAAPVLLALFPRKGWEVHAIDDRHVDPRFDTPFFNRNRPPSKYDEELHLRYMEALAISAIYTNAVFAAIDERLGTNRLADPDEARTRVLAEFQAIPGATLRAMLDDAASQVVGGHFTTDLAGSGNIHFYHSGAGDFVADARGLTWTRAGGVWFGDSRINGQSVNLRLASTASLTQREAQSGSQGADANARVEGSGGVSVGR